MLRNRGFTWPGIVASHGPERWLHMSRNLQVRTLGIPTVLDRLIQQALLQVLEPIVEPTFSASSYGFRPGRSAHQAVRAAKHYVQSGRTWVVDMDLEKFFDRVNHDILMSRVARHVDDERVLKLIRRYLEAGLMRGGVGAVRERGTPQGGPLSPFCRTSCSPTGIANWRNADTRSVAMRTTATSTSVAKRQGSA